MPGEKLAVRTQVWNSGGRPVGNLEIRLLGKGFEIAGQGPPPAAPGFFATKLTDERQLEVAVLADAPLTVPYFRRRPLAGDLYDWRECRPSSAASPSSRRRCGCSSRPSWTACR